MRRLSKTLLSGLVTKLLPLASDQVMVFHGNPVRVCPIAARVSSKLFYSALPLFIR